MKGKRLTRLTLQSPNLYITRLETLYDMYIYICIYIYILYGCRNSSLNPKNLLNTKRRRLLAPLGFGKLEDLMLGLWAPSLGFSIVTYGAQCLGFVVPGIWPVQLPIVSGSASARWADILRFPGF